MPVLRFAQQRVQKHWAATSVPAERSRVRIVVPHSMTDNNSRYDIHSVYSGNYFCNICFHKLHNFHTFIDIIFTILCAPVPRISLTLWPPKLTGPRTGRRFIRYWTKRFAGHAAAAGLLTGLSLSVWAGLLMFGSMLFYPHRPGGDARASGTAVRSLCWPRWAATWRASS